ARKSRLNFQTFQSTLLYITICIWDCNDLFCIFLLGLYPYSKREIQQEKKRQGNEFHRQNIQWPRPQIVKQRTTGRLAHKKHVIRSAPQVEQKYRNHQDVQNEHHAKDRLDRRPVTIRDRHKQGGSHDRSMGHKEMDKAEMRKRKGEVRC